MGFHEVKDSGEGFGGLVEEWERGIVVYHYPFWFIKENNRPIFMFEPRGEFSMFIHPPMEVRKRWGMADDFTVP